MSTEDYIEAVYRWSTGAVELFWATVFSSQFTDFLFILAIFVVFGGACFVQNFLAYWAWVAMLLLLALGAFLERSTKRRPFRRLNTSSTGEPINASCKGEPINASSTGEPISQHLHR